MSNALTISGSKFLPLSSALPAGIGNEDPGFLTTNDLSGFTRITLKNNRFRIKRGGDSDGELVGKGHSMHMVFLKVHPHQQRIYYKEKYDPDNPTPMSCASNDGVRPIPDAPEPQAKKCSLCPMSKKGSGGDEYVACSIRRGALIALLHPSGEWELARMNLSWSTYAGPDSVNDGLFNIRSLSARCKRMGVSPDVVLLEATFAPDEGIAPSTVRFTPVAALDKAHYQTIQDLLADVDDEVLHIKTVADAELDEMHGAGVEDEEVLPASQKTAPKKAASKKAVAAEPTKKQPKKAASEPAEDIIPEVEEVEEVEADVEASGGIEDVLDDDELDAELGEFEMPDID